MNEKARILIGQFNDEDDKPFLKTMSYEELANGIIIAGKSNSGKTNTVESIIYQMILRYGAYFMIGDYRGGSEKSITPRLLPFRNAFLADIAIEGDEIIALIEQFQQIAENRLRGIDTDKTPIVLVVDEFISFALRNKPPKVNNIQRIGTRQVIQSETTYFNVIDDLLFNARRVNMSMIIIGQNFTQQEGLSGLRVIKDAFANKIIHRLEPTDAKQFGFDTKAQNVIAQFRPGVAFYDGRIVKVPLVLSNLQEAALSAANKYKPLEITCAADTQDTFLEDMLQKYGNKKISIESREDVMRFLKYNAGLSYYQVREYRLPGNNEALKKLYDEV